MALPDDLAATLATVRPLRRAADQGARPTRDLRTAAVLRGRRARHRRGRAGHRMGSVLPHGALFHVVLEGSGEVRRHGAVTARVGPGDYIGELSLIDGGPRTAEVVAGPDGLSSLAFDKWTFAELLEEHPEVAVPMLRVTIARLRRCQDELHGEE